MTWNFWWISGLIASDMGTLTRKDWCEKERKLWASFAVDSYSSVLRWTVIVQNYHDKRGKNKCRNFGRCIYNWQYCCKHTCLLSGRIFRHCHCRPVPWVSQESQGFLAARRLLPRLTAESVTASSAYLRRTRTLNRSHRIPHCPPCQN